MEIILCLSYHISLFQILLAVSNKIVRLDCPSLLIGFIIIVVGSGVYETRSLEVGGLFSGDIPISVILQLLGVLTS